MLALSSEDEEPGYRNIVSSTKAVMFLGTPHRGSQMAGIGKLAERVARLALMDTNNSMLNALGLKTSDLERCQDSFMKLWRQHNFHVKTFQEGRGYTAINVGLSNEKVGAIGV